MMIGASEKIMVTAFMAGVLVLLHSCATTEELYSQYDNTDCEVQIVETIIENNVVKDSLWVSSVYFGYDSDELNSGQAEQLELNIALLETNADLKVVLQGSTDVKGADDYNLALGERRAQTVADFFIAAGIASDRFFTHSHGKYSPIAGITGRRIDGVDRRVDLVLLDSRGRPLNIKVVGFEQSDTSGE